MCSDDLDNKTARSSQRLESWKAIANYLSRTVRTVQRWESEEGLPVHRHLHRKQGSVYAYAPELDGWVARRSITSTSSPKASSLGAASPFGGTAERRARSRPRFGLLAGAAAAALAVYLAVVSLGSRPADIDGAPESTAPVPRQRVDSPDVAAASLVGSRLAVLPLSDVSPDPEDDYFADGMTQELISRLSKLSGLRVIASSSVMRYRSGEQSLAEIARELDVGVVLQGGVRNSGNRIRLHLQLVNTGTEEPIWSEDFQAPLTDAFAAQRELAERVAQALHFEIREQERDALTSRGTDHPEAYAEYLRGRYFLGKLDRVSFLRARDHFQQALDLDPLFPQAWSGLADAYNHLTRVAVLRSSDASPRARAAAEHALDLDPHLAEAHAALALVLTMYYGDSEAAERHFRRAIDLNPSYAMARLNYAAHLRNLGRLDEALAEAQKAQQLDPLSVFPRHEQGVISCHASMTQQSNMPDRS